MASRCDRISKLIAWWKRRREARSADILDELRQHAKWREQARVDWGSSGTQSTWLLTDNDGSVLMSGTGTPPDWWQTAYRDKQQKQANERYDFTPAWWEFTKDEWPEEIE